MGMRPRQGVPIWASDATYPAGANPWQIAPNNKTKVTPSAGKIAEGWDPSEQPPAQFLNWFQNQVGNWSTYLDGIDVKNWAGAADIGAGVSASADSDLAWAEDRSKLYLAVTISAGVSGIYSSTLGQTWATETLPATRPTVYYTIVAGAPGTDVILAAGNNADRITRKQGAAAWANLDITALTLTSEFRAAAHLPWAPADSRFILGTGNGNAAIVYLDSAGATQVEVDLGSAGHTGGFLNGPDHLAVGAARVLAVSARTHAGGSGVTSVKWWYSDDGQAWVGPFAFDGGGGRPNITTVSNCFYDASSGTWWIQTSTGFRYYSTDCVTWTAKGSGSLMKDKSVATHGSVWTGIRASGINALCYSLDEGENWTLLPNFFEGLTNGILQYTRRVGDRFAAIANPTVGADDFSAVFSLRT